jgi:GTP-binding protein
MVVATKTDKLNRKEEQQSLAAIRNELSSPDLLIPFSALSGRGVREIWQAISKTRNSP